jgi:hypothetical protein
LRLGGGGGGRAGLADGGTELDLLRFG